MQKYELTDESCETSGGRTLHRIRALRDIPRHRVQAGDLGGLVESEENLRQDGDAWVGGNAQVYCNATIGGNALIGGDTMIVGNALIGGDTMIGGDAMIAGNAVIGTAAP